MIGTRLSGRFEILRELGRGGMGVVYLARDEVLERDVAVKVISPHLLGGDAVERFRREARLVARMDHPGIVGVHDVGEHETSLYLVMPYVTGTSLRALLDSRSCALGEMLEICAQVAEALEYSHSMGVVHRDIKPENILIVRQDPGLRVRITDFGLARTSSDSRLTLSGAFVGTVAYLSPEQVMAGEIDGRSDLYSLGVILYEYLTGAPPFTGEIHTVLFDIVSGHPRTPREAGAEVDEQLESLTLQCIAKDPAARPQRAQDLADALHSLDLRLHESERLRMPLAQITPAPGKAAGPFVGREREMSELQHRLAVAAGGECQFVVISGEAGIGKTRMLNEFERYAGLRETRVLRGRFMEQEGTLPYQAFCDVIQHYLHRTPSHRSSAPADLSDLAGELVSLFPVLAEEFGSEFEPASPRSPQDRTFIFDLLARCFLRIGSGKPLVIFFEDLQYGQISLEALQYVIRRLGPTPTLIVGTYRSTDVDKHHPLWRMLQTFEGDRRYLALALGPLTATQHRDLVSLLVGSSDLEAEFVQRIFDTAEGNPHYTRELVRALLDSRRIVQKDTGAWSLSTEGTILTEWLPPTLHDAVERRLDRLPENLRDALSLAALLGRTFEERDLGALAGQNVDDALDSLLAAGFLEEVKGTRNEQLSFTSSVVRDILYEGIPRRKRRALHRKYAELLERRHADRPERVYGHLLHHFGEGDAGEKAIEYGMAFIRKSLGAFSPDEALKAGKTVMEYLMEEGTSSPLVAELRILLAEAHRMKGNVEAALQELEAAVRNLERTSHPERVVQALVAAAEAAWDGRRIDPARRWLEKGLEMARRVRDEQSLARLLSLAATLANRRGEYEQAVLFLEELEKIKGTSAEERTVPRGGRLRAAIPMPLDHLHPAMPWTQEEADALAAVYQTLLQTDEGGNLKPCLCTSWEMQDQGRRYILQIRSNVRLHDGRMLTAELVREAWEETIRLGSKQISPAFLYLEGLGEFLNGATPRISGLSVPEEDRLQIDLREAMPIYPAFLTDTGTAVACRSNAEWFAGTGAFRIRGKTQNVLELERHDLYWKGSPPLEAIEFHSSLSSSESAARFREGALDLVTNLLPADLESVLHDRRLRSGIAEVSRRNTYFAIFHTGQSPFRHPEFRRAVASAVRINDLVRGTLGRMAQPAEGLFPPGILGHDPGRRQRPISIETAREMLQSSGEPLAVRALVHPIYMDRYANFVTELFRVWKELGLNIQVLEAGPDTFFEMEHAAQGIDLVLARYIPDYDDPDAFARTFHPEEGIFRNYYPDAITGELIEKARSERKPQEREKLYRKLEDQILGNSALLPLFHETAYRIYQPRVRGISLRPGSPCVNYEELGLDETADTGRSRGSISVPLGGDIPHLDPAHTVTSWQEEVYTCVFETLTEMAEGGRAAPLLASEIVSENEGRSYRIRLRSQIRFHDGRRLSSRDVRYSFERLLLEGDPGSTWPLMPVAGARELASRKEKHLRGFHLISPLEFRMDLEQPVAFFPALLATTPASIVAEGSTNFANGWKEGCVGTGPFRVTMFGSEGRIAMEAFPQYWKEGYPRLDQITFQPRSGSDEVLRGFRAGEYSLAWDLLPRDADELRHDAEFAPGYRETPGLSTYMVVFSIGRNPFQQEAMRRRVLHAIDPTSLVRRLGGRLATPATGLIPPGMLGHDPKRTGPQVDPGHRKSRAGDRTPIRVAVHSIYEGPYALLLQEILDRLDADGFQVEVVDRQSEYCDQTELASRADINITRWIADYPDPDAFTYTLVHSKHGWHGGFCGTPELDLLIEQGRSESAPDVRHRIYSAIEEAVSRQLLVLPLFHEQIYRFARPEVQGLSFRYTFPTINYARLSTRTL